LESTVIGGGQEAPLETLGKRVRSLVRALAWARVLAWACRQGPGGRSGQMSGGLASGKGSFWDGCFFLEVVAIRYY